MIQYFSKAVFIAAAAHDHVKQKRKYTGEDYIHHPLEVVQILREHGITDDEILSAAVLHDVIEDTKVNIDDLHNVFLSDRIIRLVFQLTEPEHVGNRAARKAAEVVRLGLISEDAQTIKYADLISNTRSIVKYDRDFAKVYLVEKWRALKAMTDGDRLLRIKAMNVCTDAARIIGLDL